MKWCATALLTIGLVAVIGPGCSVQNDPGAGSKQQNALKAPEDYVRGVMGARDRAADVVGTGAINKAIEAYNLQYGRNPASLEELKDKGLLASIPPAPAGKKYQYDSRAGTVSIVDM